MNNNPSPLIPVRALQNASDSPNRPEILPVTLANIPRSLHNIRRHPTCGYALALFGGLAISALSHSVRAQVTSGNVYTLAARHSGLVLDASGGGTGNGTPLIQSTYHGGSNQLWTVNSLGSGQYNLIGVGSGRAMDVNGASLSDNAGCILQDWQNSSNQKVTLQDRGGGYYSLIFVHSGKALSVSSGSTASGAGVVQLTNNGATSAQWQFRPTGPAGYLWCANENANIAFGQTVDVAYGANGSYSYKTAQSGSVAFSNANFGDPIVNVVKAGFYKVNTSTGAPQGYLWCANENGSFAVPAGKTVYAAYGANGVFHFKFSVGGTVQFNNAMFGDPTPGVVKAGYYKINSAPGLPTPPPAPPALSDSNIAPFINLHTKYNGGSASAYTWQFREFLGKAGGDRFLQRLYTNWPNTMLDITSSYTGVAGSSGGNTVFGKAFWDANPNNRVPVLLHEYIHHLDNGSSLQALYNAAVADPSKQWDSYAMVSPAEFIASGYEWIVTNNMSSDTESARQKIYRMHPDFYNYMVNTWIPAFYQ